MRLALESDMEVVGEAGNGQEALALAGALLPDVVLMDVEMPVMDGLTAARALYDARLGVVVMVSIRDDQETRTRAQAAGVHTFLGKQQSVEQLLWAVREAAREAAR